MRKFTSIFVAVVLCLAAFAVCASAASTKCSDGEHDWSAWTVVEILEDGTKVEERTCACGIAPERRTSEPEVIEHEHDLLHVEAVEGCHTAGMKEYWYCEGCDTHFADEKCEYPVAYLSLATEPTVELGFVPATEACHKPGSLAYWQCPACDQVFADVDGVADAIPTTRKNLETAPDTELVHHEAVAPCHANGYNEYWYCPDCDGYFTDAAGTQITNIKNLTVEGDLSKLEHSAKVEPTATETGMEEYWYCAGCDCYFTDAEGKMNIARLSLVIPALNDSEHIHELVYTAAVAATCETEGNLEYWYCAGCDCYFTDAEGKMNIARLSLILPVDHTIEHVEAKAPTATENGNIEYWYCKDCGYAWLDEYCIKNTNLKAVILPATGETPINPDTGDNAIFFIVALVAVATVGVAVISFKKREN